MANENREPYVLDFPNGQRVEDILKKADADYSKAEIDAKMAQKATMSDVERETQNLQNQINEIVRAPESGGDVAAEVAQARVGADSTVYPTLKARLDAEEEITSDTIQGLIDIVSSNSAYSGGWEDGYYAVGTGSTRGRSSTSVKYRRTKVNVDAVCGSYISVVPPTGYIVGYVSFSTDHPNTENGGDNSAVYTGGYEGERNETLNIRVEPGNSYFIYISLKNDQDELLPEAFPEISFDVDKISIIEGSISDLNDKVEHETTSLAGDVQHISKSVYKEQPMSPAWEYGYYQVGTGSTRGRSSTSANYRRIVTPITEEMNKTTITPPEGYIVGFAAFSSYPNTSNGADNSSIYVGGYEGERGEKITIIPAANTYYYAYINLKDQQGDLQPVAYPEITYNISKIDAVEEKFTISTVNLYDADEAQDDTVVSTSGDPGNNPGYWSSGYVAVSGLEQILIQPSVVYRVIAYDSSSNFISMISRVNPIVLPDNAAFIRFSVSKTIFPFSKSNSIQVVSANLDTHFSHRSCTKDVSFSDWQYVTTADFEYLKNADGSITSDFYKDILSGSNYASNTIFTCMAYYEGEEPPTIAFAFTKSLLVTSGMYFAKTIDHIMCGKNLTTKQWRMPPFPMGYNNMRIIVTIPTGTKLYIRRFNSSFEAKAAVIESSPCLNWHSSFMAPFNTEAQMVMASQLGFKACIAVPKVTRDGVFVCFHDDSVIGNTLKKPDGSDLDAEDFYKSIEDLTYAELMQFDAGISRDICYAGEKVPTVSEFFDICARTGMRPMFSVHPLLTASQWGAIKDMAKKKGVLGSLCIKAGNGPAIRSIYDVLGADIYSYTIDVSTDRSAIDELDAIPADRSKVNLGIEYFGNVISDSKVENVLNAGYFVACALGSLESGEAYRHLSEIGVSEFTADNILSAGLNW